MRSHLIHQVDSAFICLLTFLTYFDHLGNVYIADTQNNRIRKVTVSTGIITTFAGTGTDSYSGDNGPATSAELKNPSAVILDASGMKSTLIYFIQPSD